MSNPKPALSFGQYSVQLGAELTRGWYCLVCLLIRRRYAGRDYVSMSDHISIVDSCPVNTWLLGVDVNGKSMVKRRLDGRNYSVDS